MVMIGKFCNSKFLHLLHGFDKTANIHKGLNKKVKKKEKEDNVEHSFTYKLMFLSNFVTERCIPVSGIIGMPFPFISLYLKK